MAFNREEAVRDRAFQEEQAGVARRFNSQQALLERRFAGGQAHLARKWEGAMSSTAYQRQVRDLTKAGLNPILALTRGGASTPSSPSPGGSAASGPSAGGSRASFGSPAHFEDSIGRAVSTALASYRLNKEMKNVEANTTRTEEETENVRTNNQVLTADADKRRAEVDEVKARTEQIKTDTALSVVRQGTEQAQQGKLYAEQSRIGEEIKEITARIEKTGVATQHEREQLRQLKLHYNRLANESEVEGTSYGKAMAYLRAGQPLASSAQALTNLGLGAVGLKELKRIVTPKLKNILK